MMSALQDIAKNHPPRVTSSHNSGGDSYILPNLINLNHYFYLKYFLLVEVVFVSSLFRLVFPCNAHTYPSKYIQLGLLQKQKGKDLIHLRLSLAELSDSLGKVKLMSPLWSFLLGFAVLASTVPSRPWVLQ